MVRRSSSLALALLCIHAGLGLWHGVCRTFVARPTQLRGNTRGSGVSRRERRPSSAEAPPTTFNFLPVGQLDDEEVSVDDKGKSYNWYKQWYPVHFIDSMDPTRPHKTQILGIRIVMWNDGPTVNGQKQDGTWRVFKDSCPHRAAPLSEGRVEADGTLLCSYHAWRFDGEGKNVDNPYLSEKMKARQCGGGCRGSCGSFPTKVVDGMVFVFPYQGLDKEEEAAKVDPVLIHELHDADPESVAKWSKMVPAGVRDFPCGWDTMVENTLDPAHFTSAHHNTMGNRYNDPAEFYFKKYVKLGEDGAFRLDGDMGRVEFHPPCLVKYYPDFIAMPFQGSLVVSTYCVPVGPGVVRPLATVLQDPKATGDVATPTLATRATSFFFSVPDWLKHVLSPVVLHQDSGLLYGQYRNLRSQGYHPGVNGSLKYESLVNCPTTVDRGAITFRRWLRKVGGGDVPWACDDVLPARGTEDIYDTWNAHTKNCKYCQDSYRNLEFVKYACLAAFLAVVIFMPMGQERITFAVGTLFIGGVLNVFNGLFIRYESSHADNN